MLTCNIQNDETNNIDDILRRFWEIEELEEPIPISPDHEQCEKLFTETTIILSDAFSIYTIYSFICIRRTKIDYIDSIS